MAFKEFQLDGLGAVTIYKRRGARSIRLSIRSDGSLRVTIPTWTPYAAGITFAQSRATWIRRHKPPMQQALVHDQPIGKAHRLRFVPSSDAAKPASRIRQSEITITYPPHQAINDTSVQQVATRASIRALRRQAEQLLPRRLAELAEQHGFTYQSVAIKHLKTRWGSCDQSRNITLNLFLMQLPWRLIDYVLLHELTHTRVMQHGPTFWTAMSSVAPDVQALRKEIRGYHPTLLHLEAS